MPWLVQRAGLHWWNWLGAPRYCPWLGGPSGPAWPLGSCTPCPLGPVVTVTAVPAVPASHSSPRRLRVAVRVGPPGVHPPRTGVGKEERRVRGGGTAWLWAPGRGRQGVSPPLALHLGLFPASEDTAGTEGGLLVEAQGALSVPGASGNPGGSPSVSLALGIERCWAGRGAGPAMTPTRLPRGWPAGSRSMVSPGRPQGQKEGLRRSVGLSC